MKWLEGDRADAKEDAKPLRGARMEGLACSSWERFRRHLGTRTLAEMGQGYHPGRSEQFGALRMLPMLEVLGPLGPKAFLVGLTLAGRPLLFDLENREAHHILIEEADEARAAELLRNLAFSLALSTTPAQAQLFPVDMGGRGLTALEGLPHAPLGMASDAESLQSLLVVLAKEIGRRQDNKVPIPHLVVAVHELHRLPQRGLAAQLEDLLRLGAAGRQVGVHLFMTGSPGTMDGLPPLEEEQGLALIAPALTVDGTNRGPLVVTSCGRKTAFTAAEMTVHDLDWATRQIALRGRQDFRSRGVGLWPPGLYRSAKGQHDAHGERPRQ